ncbi:hypothetical protein [Mycobacterium marinum]|nr:hypothetical protein [Mycobacterium marinum]
MSDSRKFPWLSGLVASLLVATVLIVVAVHGTFQVLNDFGAQSVDIGYQP